MTRDELLDWMARHKACDAATEWVQAQPAESTAQELWMCCEEPGHMLWLAGRGTATQAMLVCVAADIALSVQHLIPPGELRDASARAIEAALAWADAPSEATRAEADAAAYVAYTAAYAAYAAARAAAFAAYAVHADACAADAAYAAYAACAAACAAAAQAAAQAVARRDICDLIRSRIPEVPL